MSFSLLFNYQPTFYAAISSYLPLQDQSRLSRVSKGAKLLVEAANIGDHNKLKLSSIYENCKEQIKQLRGPWRAGQEVQDRIQAAIPLIDQELKNSCKSLGIRDAKGAPFDLGDKPRSIMEKVKIAGLIDNKKAENLIRFFQQLATQIPQAQPLEKTLSECKTTREKAQQIRGWMQGNRGLLSKIKQLAEIGGIERYFSSYHSSLPAEVFLLDGLGQDDFYRIVRNSLQINCPFLIREIVKNPRLIALPPKWLGKLLETAAASGVLQFIITLMNREIFLNIPAESIVKSFEIASQKKDLLIIQSFMTNSRFIEIPDIDIGQAVHAGVELSNLTLINDLIKDGRFELIEINRLSGAIYLAINNRRTSIAKTLLISKRACSIPYEDLSDMLETAYSKKILDDLESSFTSYCKTLGPPSQTLSWTFNSDMPQTENDLRHDFIRKAISIISGIKGDHDDIVIDSDSESDEESSKENLKPFNPGDKRPVDDEKTDEPDAKRRKILSPSSIYAQVSSS